MNLSLLSTTTPDWVAAAKAPDGSLAPGVAFPVDPDGEPPAVVPEVPAPPGEAGESREPIRDRGGGARMDADLGVVPGVLAAGEVGWWGGLYE